MAQFLPLTRKATLYRNHPTNNLSKNGNYLIRRENSTSATIFFRSCYSFDSSGSGQNCQHGHVLQYQQCNNGPGVLLLLVPYRLTTIEGSNRAEGRKRLTIVSFRDACRLPLECCILGCISLHLGNHQSASLSGNTSLSTYQVPVCPGHW